MFRKHMFFVMVIASLACLNIVGCAGGLTLTVHSGSTKSDGSNSSDWVYLIRNGSYSYTTSGVFKIDGDGAKITVKTRPGSGWIPIAGEWKEEPSNKWHPFGVIPKWEGNPWKNLPFTLKNHKDGSNRRIDIKITFACYNRKTDRHGEAYYVLDGEITVVQDYTFFHKPAWKKN